MNPTTSLLLDALNDGMNLKLVLQALQMPDDIFQDKLDTNGFTPDESRIIKQTIRQWEEEL